jgi:hypothetical protein
LVFYCIFIKKFFENLPGGFLSYSLACINDHSHEGNPVSFLE